MKIALYARCSTNDKKQDTTSQFTMMKEYCDRKEYPYTDEDLFEDYESGKLNKIKKRAGFEAMIQNLREGIYDGILLVEEARFARSVELGLRLEREIEELDKFVEFAQSGVRYDHCATNPVQKTMLIISLIGGEVANMQHALDVKRGIDGLKKEYAEEGKTWHWGRKHMQLDAHKVIFLKQEGKSLREIATAMGCSTAPIRRILKNSKPKSV